MRFRRRRSGSRKREPLYWARVCLQTSGSVTGQDVALDCESSEVQFGAVVFDPAAVGQFGTNESRITLRSLRIAGDLALRSTNSATLPDFSMWSVFVKTSGAANAVVGTPLTTLLDSGTFDVVGIRMFGGRAGNAAIINNGGPFTGSLLQMVDDWDINVQRKLDTGENISMLCGFLTHSIGALLSTHILSGSVNMAVSALWQRTLT